MDMKTKACNVCGRPATCVWVHSVFQDSKPALSFEDRCDEHGKQGQEVAPQAVPEEET